MLRELGLLGLALLGWLVSAAVLWWFWNVGEDFHHIVEDEDDYHSK